MSETRDGDAELAGHFGLPRAALGVEFMHHYGGDEVSGRDALVQVPEPVGADLPGRASSQAPRPSTRPAAFDMAPIGAMKSESWRAAETEGEVLGALAAGAATYVRRAAASKILAAVIGATPPS